MLDALTYQEMLRNIKQNMEYWGVKDDIIGILITRPDLNTGKNILDSLEYYHFRTGQLIFICLDMERIGQKERIQMEKKLLQLIALIGGLVIKCLVTLFLI